MRGSFGWIPVEYIPESSPPGVDAKVWLHGNEWRWSVRKLNRAREFLGRLTEFFEHGRCESLADAWDAALASMERAENPK